MADLHSMEAPASDVNSCKFLMIASICAGCMVQPHITSRGQPEWRPFVCRRPQSLAVCLLRAWSRTQPLGNSWHVHNSSSASNDSPSQCSTAKMFNSLSPSFRIKMNQDFTVWMAQYGSIWFNMVQWFTLAYFIFQVWRVTRDQTRPASTADPGHPGPRYASDLNTVYGIPVYHIRISRYPNTIKYPDIQYPADQWFAVFLSVLNCLPHCCGSMN